MSFRDQSARSHNPRSATLNVPFNIARTRGAMMVDVGEITGIRNSTVDAKKVLVVNGKQVYYVERQMADAFKYGVGDRVRVWKHSSQYYFTATKMKACA